MLCWQGLYLHTVKLTVCSTSDRLEKHMGKWNTGCCWYKFSEFKSLESSDSVQHNEGNQETRRNRRARTRKQATKERGQVSELISPACWFPPFLDCRRRYSISSILAEAGNVQSRPRFNDNPSHCSCVSTHHIVLECTWVLTHHVVLETPSVKKCTWLLLCCWLPKLHWVMRAELIAELLRLSEKKRSPFFYSFFHFSLPLIFFPLC